MGFDVYATLFHIPFLRMDHYSNCKNDPSCSENLALILLYRITIWVFEHIRMMQIELILSPEKWMIVSEWNLRV